jgi:hypothetical protein
MPTRRRSIVAIVLLAVAGAAAQSQPERIPVPPIRTSLGPMPGVNDVPATPELPDVMVLNNGQRVTTANQWRARREEMKRLLGYYATGLMPPEPGNVKGREIASQLVLGGQARYRLVHLSFGPRESLGFDVAIFTPTAGQGPFPTIVHPSFAPTPGGTPLATMVRPPEQGKGIDALTIPLGDQSGRVVQAPSQPAAPLAAPPATPTTAPKPPVQAAAPTAAPQAAPKPPASDPESVAATFAELFRRGYALVTWHYQDTGEDTIGRNLDGSWAFRTTRFFPAYPNHDWGLLAGWAWGISRAIDYLETQPFADKTKFIAIGHSRIGKAVLVAGAFDERIALVAPAGSGAGGTGAYRFNGASHGGKEGLADMMRKYPNWFSPSLYEFAANTEKLPFDQHWLVALAAPRAFISLEGTDDQNCVPNALKQAWLGAMPAYTLLQASSRLGVNYANHRHALTDDDWVALLDFADQQLRGKAVPRRFDVFPPS